MGSFPAIFPDPDTLPHDTIGPASDTASGKAAFQAHDVADDFGDRMIVLDRNLVVDLDGGIQRAGQRQVLDDWNVMLAGDFPDLVSAMLSTPLARQTGADMPRS